MNALGREEEALLPVTAESASTEVSNDGRTKTLAAVFLSVTALLSVAVLQNLQEVPPNPVVQNLAQKHLAVGPSEMNWDHQTLGVMCPNTAFSFNNGNNLLSESGKFHVAFQTDGNMVIYERSNKKDVEDTPIWASNTQNFPQGNKFKFQDDGHLVVAEGNNDIVKWQSNVYNWFDSVLIMQNDGNLVEYDRQSYKAIWWSGTRRDVAEENVEVKKAALQCFTRAPTAAPIANPTASPSFSPSAAPTPLPTVSPSRWTEVFSDSNAYSQNADHYKTSGNDLVVLADSPGPACTQAKAPINSFHFNQREGNGYISYSCANPSDEPFAFDHIAGVRHSKPGKTSGGVISLDNQQAYCDLNEYMTEFSFKKDGPAEMHIDYRCVKYRAEYLQVNCIGVGSDYQDPGQSLTHLSQHGIDCPEHHALQGFRGEVRDGLIRVHAMCCPGTVMYPSHNPTPRPSAKPSNEPTVEPTLIPTQYPVANPTRAPFANPTQIPTHKPSAQPIANPTERPTEFPTHEPIARPTMTPISEPTLSPNPQLQAKVVVRLKSDAIDHKEDAEKQLDEAHEVKKEADKNVEQANIKIAKAIGRIGDAHIEADEANYQIQVAEGEVAHAVQVKNDSNNAKVIGEKLHRLDVARDAGKVLDEANQEEQIAHGKIEEAAGDIEGARRVANFQDKALEDLRKDRDEAIEVREKAVHDELEAEAMYANAQADLLVLGADEGEIQEAKAKTLSCPFTFTMGVSKVTVPDGCAFFGVNDVSFKKQKMVSTPAVYFCTQSLVPVQIKEKDLNDLGLEGSISMIEPGTSTEVNFYSEDSFKGMRSSFTKDTFKPLNSWLFHDKHTANDRVKSAVLTSKTMEIPSSCDELQGLHKEEMHLNMELMKGRFEAGSFFGLGGENKPKRSAHARPSNLRAVKASPSVGSHSKSHSKSQSRPSSPAHKKSSSSFESWMRHGRV